MRLIVGISGASGVIYGIRLLEVLQTLPDVETHLVISNGGKLNISLETEWQLRDVESLADVVHSDQNLAATISSGSYQTDGMVLVPCSMKTLSGVVNSYADSLIVRAADVELKERRRLVREPVVSDGTVRQGEWHVRGGRDRLAADRDRVEPRRDDDDRQHERDGDLPPADRARTVRIPAAHVRLRLPY